MPSVAVPLRPEAGAELSQVRLTVLRYRRRITLLVQAVMFLASAICFLVFLPSGRVVPLATGLSCLCSLVSWLLAWNYRLSAAVWIIGLQFLAMATGLTINSRGIHDAAMLIYPAGMVAFALVQRPLWVVIYGALNLFSAAVVAHLSVTRLVGQPMTHLTGSEVLLDALVALVILGLGVSLTSYLSLMLTRLLAGLEKSQEELERAVAARTRELSIANQELRLTLDHLEATKDQLVETRKQASLGRLVTGMAHELNTPIGNILTAATGIEQVVAGLDQDYRAGCLRQADLTTSLAYAQEGLALVVRNAKRSAQLVDSFKQLELEDSQESRRSFALDSLWSELAASLGFECEARKARLILPASPGLIVSTYPRALSRVLEHLCRNALVHGFADKPGGTIRISCRVQESGRLHIEVEDDGRGIEAAAMGRVFDPFFSAQLGQGGLGLGLAVCHKLVSAVLGGTIGVRPAATGGACFWLELDGGL